MLSIRKLCLAGVAAAVTAFSAATFSAPVVIKFSHVVAENTPKGQMAIKFKELVDERLAGKVEVKVFPNAQLFGDNKVLEAMMLGDVQMAAPSLSKFKTYTKKLQVFDLPFLFDDIGAVERFQQGPEGRQLLHSMADKGLIGLGYLHNGMKQLSSNHPVQLPADVKGKKFRIMTSDVLATQFETVGAIPVEKPFSEVFTLLQTKTIDGQENTWSNIFSKKFFEVQPYITESNHGVLDYLVVTSVDFWNDLPADLRTEIQTALNDAIAHGNRIAAEKELADKQAIIASGRSQVLPMSADARAAWIERMTPVWNKYEDRIGKGLVSAALASNMF